MKRILIVDDQPTNLALLRGKLTVEGFEVICANNGNEGIQKTLSENPDLILLDVIMPDISGIEVCKILTSDPRTLNIPIILVTAKIASKDVQVGFQAGAFDYIKKPIDFVELIVRIKSAIKYRDVQKKLLDTTRLKTFAATVVTANHKIKQPLTIISLSLSALKREITKDDISKESVNKRIEYIEKAVNEISTILNQLNSTEKPKIAEYLRDIKMVDLDEKS
jgi:two-component system cell cycle response regulator